MKHLRVAAAGALAALILVLGQPASAADLGMDAPPLKISKWVKGQPVKLADGKGKSIYVVEFWATWCPPCRVSIPHLTALQKRFKDQGVTVIGVSNELEGKVRPFVDKQAGEMDYTVAIDDAEGTSEGYMKAFGQNGIPCAFVVDKQGRIAWVGHPMAGLDRALEEIVAGTYDIEGARRAAQVGKLLPEYFTKASEGADAASIRELGDRIVKDGAAQPPLLNEFAWTLLTHPQIKTRDLELATRAARLASEKTGDKDPAILDTYARALFMNGKNREAVDWQKKAIAASKDETERKSLEKSLREYEAKLQ